MQKLKQIPATESGIEAAARLQREDGINVNLTFVSGVIHATACAQSGAVAVTLPIAKVGFFFLFSAFFPSFLALFGPARETLTPHTHPYFVYCIQMRDWRRRMDLEENVGGKEEDAETIAAYFDLHGLSSTGLIVDRMNHVRTFLNKRLSFTSFGRPFFFPFRSSRSRGRAIIEPRA